MSNLRQFTQYLAASDFAENTVKAYLSSVRLFLAEHDRIDKISLLSFKERLIDTLKPQSVNLRLNALNKYLEFLELQHLRLKSVKIQKRTHLENVIGNADYLFLKNSLKRDENLTGYFLVWFLAATGARVSELVEIKAEHLKLGFLDLYAKGGKARRLYIPLKLKREAAVWLKRIGVASGPIFTNRRGIAITTHTVGRRLKEYAEKYGLRRELVHPHAFRHLYAKNFMEKTGDIALLADLLGHESIETTRIYLRRTAGEQQEIVNRVVTW